MKRKQRKRYKPNFTERRAVAQALKSGVSCIEVNSEKVARYVKTRLRVMLTESGVTNEICVGQRGNYAIMWMPAKFPSLKVSEDILAFAKQEGNKFICVYGLREDRNYNLDRAIVEEKFSNKYGESPSAILTDVDSVSSGALALAEKAYKEGRISLQKLEEVKQRLAKKPDESAKEDDLSGKKLDIG